MKSIPDALLQHYASSSTTITTCWKVTRRDGLTFCYTAFDRDLRVQGLVYSATVAVSATAIASSNKFEIQNVEVAGLLQEGLMALGAMTEQDILAGIWDDARVTIFEVNYVDPSMGIATMQTGRIGQLSTGRLTYTSELRGLMQNLQQSIGHTVLPGCFKDLGDENCMVDLSLFTYDGTVSTALTTRNWIDVTLRQPDHQCRGGLVTWLTGANAGLAMEVKDQSAAGDVILQSDMPYPVAIGDTYSIHAGCNKLHKRGELVYAAALTGSVTSVNGTSFVDSSRGEDDHYLDGGRFTWTGGANLDIVTEVSNFITKTFTLLGSPAFPIQEGDTYTVEPQITTGALVYDGDCGVKFDNAVNFGGFPEVPGNDKVLGAGNQ